MAKKTITRKSLARKQPRMPDKELAKVISGEKKLKPSKKAQRLVAERNVKLRLLEGWKVVGKPQDDKGKVLDVKTNASDLVLMEK